MALEDLYIWHTSETDRVGMALQLEPGICIRGPAAELDFI